MALAGCTSGTASDVSKVAASPPMVDVLDQEAPAPPVPPPSALDEPYLPTVAPSVPRPSGPRCGRYRRAAVEDVDWSDLIRFRGRTYLLDEDDTGAVLGPVVGRVRCRLLGSGAGRSYTPQDGDAAFLPAGTRLHRVAGVSISEAIGVLVDGTVEVYRAERDG